MYCYCCHIVPVAIAVVPVAIAVVPVAIAVVPLAIAVCVVVYIQTCGECIGMRDPRLTHGEYAWHGKDSCFHCALCKVFIYTVTVPKLNQRCSSIRSGLTPKQLPIFHIL